MQSDECRDEIKDYFFLWSERELCYILRKSWQNLWKFHQGKSRHQNNEVTEADGVFREQNLSDIPWIKEEFKRNFAFPLKNPQYSLQRE